MIAREPARNADVPEIAVEVTKPADERCANHTSPPEPLVDEHLPATDADTWDVARLILPLVKAARAYKHLSSHVANIARVHPHSPGAAESGGGERSRPKNNERW